FQAEDGIRDATVTGVQTCALPISCALAAPAHADCKLTQIMELPVTMLGARPTVTLLVNGQPARFLVDSGSWASTIDSTAAKALEIGRASCRERGEISERAVAVHKK